jgi:hypothetical protein
MANDVTTGATLTHANFTGSLVSFRITGAGEVTIIDSSYMGTTSWRTYVSGDLKSGGEVSADVLFNPDSVPTTGGTASNLVIVFQDGAGADTWTASAILKSFDVTAELEDLLKGTFNFQITGAWVHS